MNNKKNEVLTLLASAALLALNENPQLVRELNVRAPFYGARVCRVVAEKSWRLAMRLENDYRMKVAP